MLHRIRAAYPFGKRLFRFEKMPTDDASISVGFNDDGSGKQGAVSQKDVVIGTFHGREKVR